MPDHLHWPLTLLTSVKVEPPAVSAWIFGNDASTDRLIGLLLRHRRLPVIERIESAVPLHGDITVTITRRDHLRIRLQDESGHPRQISPGQVPDHSDAIRVNPKQFRTVSTHPSICIPNV